MDMTVGEFFCAGLPNFDNLACEVQGDARKREIGINMDDFVADCGDNDRDRAVLSLGTEGHPRLNLIVTKLLSRDLRDQRPVAFCLTSLPSPSLRTSPPSLTLLCTYDAESTARIRF